MNYGRAADGAVIYERSLDDDHELGFEARAIRPAPTGVHARVFIKMNGVVLGWSTLNVERDEDRGRLSNSAHRSMNGASNLIPKEHLKHEFDVFCGGLWEEVLKDTAAELMAGEADPQPPAFVLKPYIIRGGGSITYAPPGWGKSYLLLLMATSVDAGVDALFQVTQTPALVINLERSRQSYANRLGAVNRALGLPPTRPLRIINARGRSLIDVIESARAAIREHHIGCVFLDSISRAGYGDLNENRPVNAIADALNGLCESWFALAHTPRADSSHVYGSVHFEAASDIMVQLASEQEEGGPLGVGLQITKQNDVGKQPVAVYRLDFGPAGLTGARRAHPGEFPAVEEMNRPSMPQAVKTYLLGEGKADATTIANALGFNRSNVSSLLATDDTFVSLGKDGRRVLYGVRNGS